MRGSLILANKDICATNMALERKVITNAMTTTLKYQIRWRQTRGGTSPNNEGSGVPWLEKQVPFPWLHVHVYASSTEFGWETGATHCSSLVHCVQASSAKEVGAYM